jgi:hypothetical protein
MPGRTGKRAHPAGICVTCKLHIEPRRSFMRTKSGDEHIACWECRTLPTLHFPTSPPKP